MSRELPELYKWVQLECKAARVAEHFIDRVKLAKSSCGGEVKGLTRLLVPMICIASVKDTTNKIQFYNPDHGFGREREKQLCVFSSFAFEYGFHSHKSWLKNAPVTGVRRVIDSIRERSSRYSGPRHNIHPAYTHITSMAHRCSHTHHPSI